MRPFQNAYFDVQVINSQSKCHENITPKEAMKRAAENKERVYKERIENIEGGAFIPLIFTTKGARSYKTAKTISKIGARIANKRKESTSETIKKISQELSYAFLRSELACIRGSRKQNANTQGS